MLDRNKALLLRQHPARNRWLQLSLRHPPQWRKLSSLSARSSVRSGNDVRISLLLHRLHHLQKTLPDAPINGAEQLPSPHRKQSRKYHRASGSPPSPSSDGEEPIPPAAGDQLPTQSPAPAPAALPHVQTQPIHQQPRRTFIVRDLVHLPEIPNECIPIIERVERSLQEELAVEAGATIVVAVSGGVDSVTLLDILFILSYEHGYALHLAHVNHRLRGQESDRDETFVRSLAKRYDLPCHITHPDTASFARKHRLGIEEAARELRYRFLRQTCGTVHAQYCAVAHTADDTAETLLLNLFRGTGLTGLAGIPPKRALTKKLSLFARCWESHGTKFSSMHKLVPLSG